MAPVRWIDVSTAHDLGLNRERGCVFCGSGPTTNAHVFRKRWIEEIFPGTNPLPHRHVRRGTHGFDKHWTRNEPDIKVNCACSSCNSGWMNQLDHAAEELFLTASATGHAVKLGLHRDKQTLALWCCLVASLLDQTQRSPVVPSSSRRAIANGDVPAGAAVWMFRTDPPDWQVHVSAESRTVAFTDALDDPLAYCVTFGIHHLLAQVVLPTATGSEGLTYRRNGDPALSRQLWPDPLTPLFWPPPVYVPWEQVPELSDTFRGSG
jgi:hypothetical protein